MKITDIKQSGDIYIVTFKPTWIKKIFGIKDVSKIFKDTGNQYTFGNQSVYIRQNGKKLGNGNWIAQEIDAWKLRF